MDFYEQEEKAKLAKIKKREEKEKRHEEMEARREETRKRAEAGQPSRDHDLNDVGDKRKSEESQMGQEPTRNVSKRVDPNTGNGPSEKGKGMSRSSWEETIWKNPCLGVHPWGGRRRVAAPT